MLLLKENWEGKNQTAFKVKTHKKMIIQPKENYMGIKSGVGETIGGSRDCFFFLVNLTAFVYIFGLTD